MKSLADIFEHTHQDVYYAENAIVKALPNVAKAANSTELKKAAEEHLAETRDQIMKLEQVFKSIGKKASGEKCNAIEGLIVLNTGNRLRVRAVSRQLHDERQAVRPSANALEEASEFHLYARNVISA